MTKENLDIIVKSWQEKLKITDWKISSAFVPEGEVTRLRSKYRQKTAIFEFSPTSDEETELNVIRFCIHVSLSENTNRASVAEQIITEADKLYAESRREND